MNDTDEGPPSDFVRRSVMATLTMAGLYLTEVLIAAPLLWRFLDAVKPERGVFIFSLATTTLVALLFGWLAGRMCGDSKGIKLVLLAALAILPFVLTAFGIRGLAEPLLTGSLITVISTITANLPGVFVGVVYGARRRLKEDRRCGG